MIDLQWPAFVLERRVNQPLMAVHAWLLMDGDLGSGTHIDLGDAGELCVDGPLRPTLSFYDVSWRADARLLNARKHLVARVELEVDGWCSDATRLQLRPCARHPERWGKRRLRRYFTLAHNAVDHTAHRLTEMAAAQEPEHVRQVATTRPR